MKECITRYVVFDPTTDLFWQRTNFYAMDTNAIPVYYVQFSKSLPDANLMSEAEAREVFKELKTIKLIQSFVLKANIGNLIVTPIKITYELS